MVRWEFDPKFNLKGINKDLTEHRTVAGFNMDNQMPLIQVCLIKHCLSQRL
jgi:hypothetical protein